MSDHQKKTPPLGNHPRPSIPRARVQTAIDLSKISIHNFPVRFKRSYGPATFYTRSSHERPLGACPTLHSCSTRRNWASLDNFGYRPATDLSMRECRIHIFVGKRPPSPKNSYISSRYTLIFWLRLECDSTLTSFLRAPSHRRWRPRHPKFRGESQCQTGSKFPATKLPDS